MFLVTFDVYWIEKFSVSNCGLNAGYVKASLKLVCLCVSCYTILVCTCMCLSIKMMMQPTTVRTIKPVLKFAEERVR
jgi:hypothetical protein